MITNPTSEHREQAREIVEQFSLHKVQLIEPPTNRQYHFDHNELTDAITAYASSRDTEIREVLEGLGKWVNDEWCWCPQVARDGNGALIHFDACVAACALYTKLKGAP